MRAKPLLALSLVALVTSATWCAPAFAQSAPRVAPFSTTFCQDVASLYASPSYLAEHWPTLASAHPSTSQISSLDSSLNLVVSDSLSNLAHDAPPAYTTVATNLNSVTEAEWSTTALLVASPRDSTSTTRTRDIATITGLARTARQDFAALRQPIDVGCRHFDDTATLESAAEFLTERAQNVAHNDGRPLSASIITYVTATYPHLAHLVGVNRSGSEITLVRYALASITGSVMVCTNAPGYFAEPVASSC